MQTSRCIYCMQEKPITDFNREHVVSQFMGTYENAYVLNKRQVCKKCNSYFCDNLENILSFDSLEGLLRTEHLQKPMNVKRAIGRTRLSVKGERDIFKGLTLYISSSPGNPNKIQLEPAPAIGIVIDETKNLYEYFSIDNLPVCDEVIKGRITGVKNPIVVFGYDEDTAYDALTRRGYDLRKAKYTGNLSLSQMTKETELATQIGCKVDNLLVRLALKNLLNYICYAYGEEYISQPMFDNFRAFVRYGTLNAPLKMSISSGGIKHIPGLKNNCHLIGLVWSVIEKQVYLCGVVSWFNAVTYTFALLPVPTNQINFLPNVKLIICDNDNRVISEEEYLTVIDWPGDNTKISFLDTNLNPIKLNGGEC